MPLLWLWFEAAKHIVQQRTRQGGDSFDKQLQTTNLGKLGRNITYLPEECDELANAASYGIIDT